MVRPGRAFCCCSLSQTHHLSPVAGKTHGNFLNIEYCCVYSHSLHSIFTATWQYHQPFPLVWSPAHTCLPWAQPITITCSGVDRNTCQEYSHMSKENCPASTAAILVETLQNLWTEMEHYQPPITCLPQNYSAHRAPRVKANPKTDEWLRFLKTGLILKA